MPDQAALLPVFLLLGLISGRNLTYFALIPATIVTVLATFAAQGLYGEACDWPLASALGNVFVLQVGYLFAVVAPARPRRVRQFLTHLVRYSHAK